MFSTVCLGKENGEDINPGEIFLSRAHIFYPPKLGGKAREKSAVTALLHKYPVSLSSHSYKHNGYKHNNLSLKHL